MPIPAQNKFYRPILHYLSDGKTKTISDVRKDLIRRFKQNYQLNETELKQTIPSGENSVFESRFSWARTDLRKVGLIESPEIGLVKITGDGEKAIKAKKKLTKRGLYKKYTPQNEEELLELEKKEESPDERINKIIEEAEANIREELLKRLRESEPAFFERAVGQLITKIFGKTAVFEQTGGPNDGGIDGIVNIPLGFKILIQAKRYSENNLITPNDIKHFLASLLIKHAGNGLFITSSDFHPNTRKEIDS